MSTNSWSPYVTMDEPMLDSTRLRTTLDTADDGDEWTEDFELGDAWEPEEDAIEED